MSQAATEDGANRRSVKNILVNPRRQLKFSLALVVGCSLSVILFLMVVVFQVKQTITTLGLAYRLDADVVGAIQSALTSAVYVSMLLAFGVTGLAFVIGIRLSHRIYGPIVAINRYIDSLTEGNYKARLTLRKDDDLTEIRDSLNKLAESLEKRNSR
jgi:signal transduction histidine kinase